MNVYTAKQVTEMIREDDPGINLRTVRYYTQIGIVPPLEPVGNKRVYTQKHVDYIRAALTLSRGGETLAFIQQKLRSLPYEEVARIGESLRLYRSKQMLDNETYAINDDVIISVSPRVSAELRSKMIETVARMIEEERNG
ncbi:MerR family transcriptional regulator [Paenibacillus sp. GYB003]|uniref:MerR family transcriptional regulator n=1 Tax=Paenibacillus sp. GYB003 TaxID=2994392 RepID=UPI002F969E39